MTTTKNMITGALVVAALAAAGCDSDFDAATATSEPMSNATTALNYTPPPPPVDGVGPQYDRFRAFDASGVDTWGIKGFLPPNSELADVYYNMTEGQRLGLAAWDLFASENGEFFRVSQKVTWNGQNMLRVLDSRRRDDRFQRTGLLNDPDCQKRTTPDQFGLYLDDCARDPYSGGVVGLRLRANPKFDLTKWKALGNGDVRVAAEKWLRAPRDRFEWKSDQLAKDIEVEPPYQVAMTCTICHSAPNPLAPPADPNHATWKNIVFAIGNQYFQEGKVFGDGIPSDDFLRQVLDAQKPGTSDTSRMATDHIHNPNVINSIFNLKFRPLHQERVKQFDDQGVAVVNSDIKQDTCDGDTCEVDTFRVLKDGADSSGVSGAALRVFINIGSCFDEFKANMDPVWGVKHPTVPGRLETPISRRKLAETCADYQQLIPLAPYLVDYLKFVKTYRLKDAPGGAAQVKGWDDPQIRLGRQVYAEECATCHSSKQPESPDAHPTRADVLWEQEFAAWPIAQQKAWLKRPDRIAWFKAQVEDPAFFEQNYLSDERRYPVSLIGTNSARALGTNATPEGVWAQYASVDYQELAPVDVPLYKWNLGQIELRGSVKAQKGRGYYRTPSLWGAWATAPYLNNNALGAYTGDPSVQGRLTAYNDAMQKLLGLSERGTVISSTTGWTFLTTIPVAFDLPFPIPGLDIHKLKLGVPIPPGVPVSAVADIEKSALNVTSFSLNDVLRILFEGPNYLMEKIGDVIPVFDPIENKGHEFGLQRTPEEKRALIEFVKTL
jgi:cytochrome c5